jgi:ATP-dependent DNA helicase RecG
MSFAIPQNEGKKCEFKRDFSSMKGILRTCVAFANTAGGSIFVGIADDGTITGLGETQINAQLEGFNNTIAQSISPLILPNMLIRRIDQKNILEIQVNQGGSKPYFIKSEGSVEGVYVRSGRSTLHPSANDLKELLLLRAFEKPFDAQIPSRKATLKDLNGALLDKVYEGYTKMDLEREGVLEKNLAGRYLPTLAALMVFGIEPQRYVPESGIIVTKFNGISGREVVISHELAGNISKLATDAIALIHEYTASNYGLKGRVKFEPEHFFPAIALREFVLNALIHRKYNITGPTKVAIYDDRVEIFSPGELPPSINVESLGDGTSQLRNVLIAKFARKTKLMEKLGSGIREATRALEAGHCRPPSFLEQATSFKVVLSREKALSGKETPASVVEYLIQTKQEIAKCDLVAAGVLDRTASFTLAALVRQGILERIGQGKNTRYRKLK